MAEQKERAVGPERTEQRRQKSRLAVQVSEAPRFAQGGGAPMASTAVGEDGTAGRRRELLGKIFPEDQAAERLVQQHDGGRRIVWRAAPAILERAAVDFGAGDLGTCAPRGWGGGPGEEGGRGDFGGEPGLKEWRGVRPTWPAPRSRTSGPPSAGSRTPGSRTGPTPGPAGPPGRSRRPPG